MRVASIGINEYANSMFRFERLNTPWIDSCAQYLRATFGDKLTGATVVDYAFGRGNWSLAFRQAGATHVIAIDAAEDNVRRFSDFCRRQNVTGIECIHGNVLQEPISVTADIVWLYGIIPCIPDLDHFLSRVATFQRTGAVFLVYSYDRGSLRQFVVDAARQVLTYTTEAEFAADSFALTRAARHRARDDLVAPYVVWHTALELSTHLRQHGLYLSSRLPDFPEFLSGTPSEEFQPHQWLCSARPEDEIEAVDPPRRHATDVAALADLADTLWRHIPAGTGRTNAALGLFNTHFEAVGTRGAAEPVLLEDFLFLAYLALASDLPGSELGPTALGIFNLALTALSGEPNSEVPADSQESYLASYFRRHRIRL